MLAKVVRQTHDPSVANACPKCAKRMPQTHDPKCGRRMTQNAAKTFAEMAEKLPHSCVFAEVHGKLVNIANQYAEVQVFLLNFCVLICVIH